MSFTFIFTRASTLSVLWSVYMVRGGNSRYRCPRITLIASSFTNMSTHHYCVKCLTTRLVVMSCKWRVVTRTSSMRDLSLHEGSLYPFVLMFVLSLVCVTEKCDRIKNSNRNLCSSDILSNLLLWNALLLNRIIILSGNKQIPNIRYHCVTITIHVVGILFAELRNNNDFQYLIII